MIGDNERDFEYEIGELEDEIARTHPDRQWEAQKRLDSVRRDAQAASWGADQSRSSEDLIGELRDLRADLRSRVEFGSLPSDSDSLDAIRLRIEALESLLADRGDDPDRPTGY